MKIRLVASSVKCFTHVDPFEDTESSLLADLSLLAI